MEKTHPWVKAEREFYKKMYGNLVKGLNLSKGISVLDYGAGTGGFASFLAEDNPQIKVIAVDSDSEAIKLGEQHYKHLSNLEFIISETIPKGNYDLIFKNLVLHELNGKGDKKIIASFLKDAYNSLNKGGLISVLDNRKVSKKDFKPIYEQNQSPKKGIFEEEYEEHNRYTMKDWKNMLEKSGFYTKKHAKLFPNLFNYRGEKN